MLSGTHDTMKKIEESGNLDNWCMDNLDWLKETFGEDNLVSAVLHMDEKHLIFMLPLSLLSVERGEK